MPKYKITYKYLYALEVEADDAMCAYDKGEEIMFMREECGDLGAPESIEEDIERIED